MFTVRLTMNWKTVLRQEAKEDIEDILLPKSKIWVILWKHMDSIGNTETESIKYTLRHDWKWKITRQLGISVSQSLSHEQSCTSDQS